jgi:hypothetical protein
MRLSLGRGLLAPRSITRLVLHALAAAALSSALLVILNTMFPLPVASGLYLASVPGVTALVAVHYLRQPAAEEPLITALSFTAVAACVDLAMVMIARGEFELVHPAIGFGLPLILVLGATGLTAELVPMLRRSHT